MKARTKRKAGQGIIEVVTAAIFIIPMVLGLFDIVVVVQANTMNDKLAKSAARAAANQANSTDAHTAAENALASFQLSSYITDINMYEFNYPASKDSVTVGIQMQVRLPVPVPGCSTVTFKAVDVEPIVG